MIVLFCHPESSALVYMMESSRIPAHGKKGRMKRRAALGLLCYEWRFCSHHVGQDRVTYLVTSEAEKCLLGVVVHSAKTPIGKEGENVYLGDNKKTASGEPWLAPQTPTQTSRLLAAIISGAPPSSSFHFIFGF